MFKRADDDAAILHIQTGRLRGISGRPPEAKVAWWDGYFVVRGLDDPLTASGEHQYFLADLNKTQSKGPYGWPRRKERATGRWLALSLAHKGRGPYPD